MPDQNDLIQQFENELKEVNDAQALDDLRVRFLGKKGLVTQEFKQLGKLSPRERPARGAELNLLKERVQEGISRRQIQLQNAQLSQPTLDRTLPGRRSQVGKLHPLVQIEERVKDIFRSMGFTVETGPEIETVYYNFTALNTPEWHPARDDADTFYFDDEKLLRTETSPVQIHVLERGKLPVRMIAPGRVYRNDKPDPTHFPVFHQVEGLYVDKGVTFADLKGTLLAFYRRFFGPETEIRFRPHYFPFTEPSAEVDASCYLCGGDGCRVCKHTGWIEMGGSGMVDPKVLEGVGVDPEVWTGYAFGLGIERTAMVWYGVDDIRLFYENDLRFLRQF
ncbi:phenylalanine--tRNA ligase subunit alpha [candidate division LCP-89 bacterium B3_LCP]|uniref:Phenylalanine--tRNA ligase alpha subunit n=1 Tax=candidate division LCP-89 bacterium B3_LCP TaxID=2012998 RepID=A0A532V5I5_UNCL8|nr:MAG: phenylalanine--tRNA ligase subunit alpha [candidate division LCP-89 bacterium B3_LCP]